MKKTKTKKLGKLAVHAPAAAKAMPKRYTLAFAHPIREQLADLVTSLPHFAIESGGDSQILQNKNSWKKMTLYASFEEHLAFFDQPAPLMAKSQRFLGLLNIRRFQTGADLAVANGGFLLTKTPYITYIEKATQPFGYTGTTFNKPLARRLLRNRLADPLLRAVVFRTETAQQGFLATFADDKRIVELITQKSVWSYPPARNPDPKFRERSFKRFALTRTKPVKFLFISSSFLLKGGRELVRAFQRLGPDAKAELILVTKQATIDPETLPLIMGDKRIKLFEASFDRDALYRQFLNEAHVFVYPTYYDGFPMVINEALAADLPIVASDFFAIPERVFDGKNGMLFPSPYPNYDAQKRFLFEPWTDRKGFLRGIYEDSKAGKLKPVEDFLFTSMRKLLKNPALMLRMAKESRKVYDSRLDPDRIVRDMDALMVKAVEQGKRK